MKNCPACHRPFIHEPRFDLAVRELLHQHDMKPKQLTRKTKTGKMTVYNILYGKKPQLETMIKISEAFGITTNEFIAMANNLAVR